MIELEQEIQNVIKLVNKERLANKGKWWFYAGVCNGKSFTIKAYGTWIQILKFEHEDIRRSSSMDISVKEFKEYLDANFYSATSGETWSQVL